MDRVNREQGHDFTRLSFSARATTQIGEQVYVLGSAAALGGFNESHAVPLETSPKDFPLWRTAHDILVPTGVPIVFKLALFSGGEFFEWYV